MHVQYFYNLLVVGFLPPGGTVTTSPWEIPAEPAWSHSKTPASHPGTLYNIHPASVGAPKLLISAPAPALFFPPYFDFGYSFCLLILAPAPAPVPVCP